MMPAKLINIDRIIHSKDYTIPYPDFFNFISALYHAWTLRDLFTHSQKGPGAHVHLRLMRIFYDSHSCMNYSGQPADA